jgi:hypothetical protein
MTAKKKMGRPKKATGDRHSGDLHIRLLAHQRRALEAKAKSAGKKLSDYVRLLLTDHIST